MRGERTPRQDRSRRRRDALLQAAVELVAEGGPQAVTHRSVAARAGLPPATTGYFFASIDDLVAEALRALVAREVDELLALASRAVDAGDLIDAIGMLRPDPRAHVAQLSAYTEAFRNPALRRPVADAIDAFQDVAERLLRAAGVDPAAPAAVAFVALLDGFMLRSVARPDERLDPSVITGAMDALLAGFVVARAERRPVLGRPA